MFWVLFMVLFLAVALCRLFSSHSDQGLPCMSFVAPWHVESFWTRDQTCVPCIGRWILYHWTSREVPASTLLMPVFTQSVVYRWGPSEQLGGFIKNVEFTPELKILAGRNLHLQKIFKAHYNLNIIESIKMSVDDSCTELEKRTVNDFRQSGWVTKLFC